MFKSQIWIFEILMKAVRLTTFPTQCTTVITKTIHIKKKKLPTLFFMIKQFKNGFM